jgi:hypothetical protein
MFNNKIIVLMIGLVAGDIIGVFETCVVMHIRLKKNRLNQPVESVQVVQLVPETQYVQQTKTVEVVRVQIKTNEVIRVVTNFAQLPPVTKIVVQKEYVMAKEIEEVPVVQAIPEKPHHCRIYRMINGKYVEDPKYMEGKMEY